MQAVLPVLGSVSEEAGMQSFCDQVTYKME